MEQSARKWTSVHSGAVASTASPIPSLGAVEGLGEVALFAEVAAPDAMLVHPRMQEITAGLGRLTFDFEGLKVFYVEFNGNFVVAGCHTLHPERLAYPLDHAGIARAIRAQSRFGALPAEVQREFRSAMRGEPAADPRVHFGGTRFLAEGSTERVSGLWFEPSGSFGAQMLDASTLEHVARFHANICIARHIRCEIRGTAGTEALAARVRALVSAAE